MRARVRLSAHRRSVLEARACEMRHAATPSEALLFRALGGRQMGVLVRRQVPLLGWYIADFFVPEVRLVIEVDGEYHGRRRRADERRDRALRRAGYRVLRLEAELVVQELPVAVERVRAELGKLGR